MPLYQTSEVALPSYPTNDAMRLSFPIDESARPSYHINESTRPSYSIGDAGRPSNPMISDFQFSPMASNAFKVEFASSDLATPSPNPPGHISFDPMQDDIETLLDIAEFGASGAGYGVGVEEDEERPKIDLR